MNIHGYVWIIFRKEIKHIYMYIACCRMLQCYMLNGFSYNLSMALLFTLKICFLCILLIKTKIISIYLFFWQIYLDVQILRFFFISHAWFELSFLMFQSMTSLSFCVCETLKETIFLYDYSSSNYYLGH